MATTAVFLPEKSQGQRSLGGYSLCSRLELSDKAHTDVLDTTDTNYRISPSSQ